MLEDDVARFARLVRDKSGLALEGPRLRDLDSAINRTLEATGVGDPGALYRLLEDASAGRAALRTLVSEITIGETHFFRHRPQMEALEQHVLPEIIAGHDHDRRLRVWSAGCSTGEETYSLAILLRRALPDIASWEVTVLGTDIDVRALERARRGVYGPWSFREVPPDVESNYFVGVGRDREILQSIRDMVTFEYLNLAEDVYPSLLNKTMAVDLIVCRNVLIYLDRPTITRIADGFHRALSEGGWLLVGPAEPSQETFRLFEVHNLAGTTAYRKPAVTRRPDAPFVARDEASLPDRAPAIRSVERNVASTTVPGRTLPAVAQRDGERRSSPVTARDIPALQREAEADPASAEAPYELARLHANRLELEPALRWVAAAIARAPLFAAAHHLHALILQERDQPEDAFEALRRCTYADPDFVMGHFAMAGLLETLGQRRRAVRSLEIAARLLDARDDAVAVEGGDGLTVGRLRRLVAERTELWG